MTTDGNVFFLMSSFVSSISVVLQTEGVLMIAVWLKTYATLMLGSAGSSEKKIKCCGLVAEPREILRLVDMLYRIYHAIQSCVVQFPTFQAISFLVTGEHFSHNKLGMWCLALEATEVQNVCKQTSENPLYRALHWGLKKLVSEQHLQAGCFRISWLQLSFGVAHQLQKAETCRLIVVEKLHSRLGPN